MKRRSIAFSAIAVGFFTVTGAQAAPVSQEDFQLATTANLVSLCSATSTDPLYTAAQNFCHGFTVGTYRALATEQAASGARNKLFCPAPNTPTRDQAISAFVQWASSRPKTLGSSPTDGIAEYLAAQFPCK
jgi:predicted lipoprotein